MQLLQRNADGFRMVHRCLFVWYRYTFIIEISFQVYNAVMRWIRYDEKNRRPHLEDIVYVVRCYFLPPTFLEQQIKFCELLKKHPHCRDYLVKVMKELTSHKKCQMRKRCNPDLPTVIYVVGGYLRFSLSKLECFDPRTKIWRNLADMPTCRSGVCELQPVLPFNFVRVARTYIPL